MDNLDKILHDIPADISPSSIIDIKNDYYTGNGILMTVMLTNYCNYNCYYCIEDAPNRGKNKKNLDIF